MTFDLICAQATRASLEERRLLIEKSLDTGRLYLRSEDDESKAAAESGGVDGTFLLPRWNSSIKLADKNN